MFVLGHFLQWYVLRTNVFTNEVTRGQKVHVFDLSQNLEYRYKRPYQGQERTNMPLLHLNMLD